MSSSLTEEQAKTWREKGAVVVQLPEAIYKPVWTWLEENLTVDKIDKSHRDFGTPDARFEFPTKTPVLDDFVLNEYFINAAEQLLDTKDLRLIQADLWPKIGVDPTVTLGSQDNTNQRMHMDYGNNTLLHIPDWNHPDVLAAIVYWDDSEVCDGGTAYVHREGEDDAVYKMPYVHMPGQGGRPFINDRTEAEKWFKENDEEGYKLRQELYKREQRVQFKPGTVLFYRQDIWHRGTPVKEGKLRRVHNLAWKRADSRGVTTWNRGWARGAYYGDIERLISRSSPKQRATLDFPLPSDSYWTPARLANVEARYSAFGFDPAPYRAALAATQTQTLTS